MIMNRSFSQFKTTRGRGGGLITGRDVLLQHRWAYNQGDAGVGWGGGGGSISGEPNKQDLRYYIIFIIF